jgi:exosortase E/protease (VPEID-CTERM system)
VSPVPIRRLNLAARACLIALLLYLEKFLLSFLIDVPAEQAAQGFDEVVRQSQHWTIHFLIALAVALAIFGYARRNEQLAALDDAARDTPMRPRWLLLHAALALTLAPLTYSLFGGHGLHLPLPLTVGLWLLSALGALLAACAAMAPAALWRRFAAALGMTWLYAAIVAIAGASAVSWSEKLWAPTAKLTFSLVLSLLSPFVPTLRGDPATLVLATDHFAVSVSERCSGLEGVGMMLAFCCAWLLYFRKEYIFPRALLLIPAGLALIFALNVLRIAALVLIGHAGFSEAAIFGFHSQAGWIAFNFAACAMVFVSRRSRWLSRAAVRDPTLASDNPTAAYLLPFLAILTAGVVAHTVSNGFETLYGLRLIAAACVLGLYWRTVAALDWRFTWRGPAAGIAVFVLWVIAAHFLTAPGAMPRELAATSPALRMSWIAVRVAAAVITVPIAEELAYRGFLLRRLEAREFESVPFAAVGGRAILLSALAFGLGHGAMWLPGVAAGVIYGLIVKRTARLGEAVAAHATTNALLAAFILLLDQWQLW